MADLETAGGQALDKLKELLPRFEEADEAFDDAQRYMKGAQQSLEEDWSKVKETAGDFLEQVQWERGELASKTQGTVENIAELKAKVTEITAKAEKAADDAQEELEEFTEDVGKLEPEIETLMKKVDDAANSLKEKAEAIEEKLEAVSTQVSDFLENEVVNDFKTLEQEVEDRTEAFNSYLTGEVMPKMEEKASDLAESLSNLAKQLQQKMEEAGNNATQQATEALEKCFAEHREVIDAIAELGQRLQEQLEALSDALDGSAKLVGDTNERVDKGVETTSAGLNSVVGTIKELLEFLSRFTFA